MLERLVVLGPMLVFVLMPGFVGTPAEGAAGGGGPAGANGRTSAARPFPPPAQNAVTGRDPALHGGPRNVLTRPFAFTNYWSWQNGAYTPIPRGTPQYLEVFKY